MNYIFYNKNNGYPLECMTFYDKMSSNERYLHLNDPNLRNFHTIDIFFQLLHNHIYNWTEEYEQFIYACNDFLTSVVLKNNVLYFFLDKMFKRKVYIILTSDDYEFGLPFTLSNYIFIPLTILYKNLQSKNYKQMSETLFHEHIHILQRDEYQTNIFKDNIFVKFSNQLNYIYYDKYNPQFIYKIPNKNWILNPDTYEHGVWFYKNKKNNNLYFYILNVVSREKKQLERIGFVYDNKTKIWKKTNYRPFNNRVHQFEHPYELIAESMTKAIFDGYLIFTESDDITKWYYDYFKKIVN